MTSQNPMIQDQENHARFMELCAVYTSGVLEREELEDLNEHLASCQACRSRLAEFQTLAQISIPRLAGDASIEEVSGFDRELADVRARLLAEVDRQRLAKVGGAKTSLMGRVLPGARILQYAAFIFLALGLTASGYFFGVRKSQNIEGAPQAVSAEETRLQTQLHEVRHERDDLRLLLAQRDETIHAKLADSSRQLSLIARLQKGLEVASAEKSQNASAIAGLIAENMSMKSDQNTVSSELQRSKDGYAELERKLAEAQQEVAQVRADRTAVQAEDWTRNKQVDDLTAQISEQKQLLRADRDIRDLMGARDLLISDVMDIDTRGHNKKPFGRIFYTKNKSLVFYAFDLDKQPGLRTTTAFQVWGARATNKGNEFPVSMGVFYKDSATAQRWVLQFDDPKVLGQIDSVFVTAEPEGGSVKPSGKQFLFSYLRGESNHP